MKVNEKIALLTPKVLLVPYSDNHVPTYHAWMQDEELQQATASEPLTLAQEYDMQRSWRDDADKLTFIACVPPSKDDLGSKQAITSTVFDRPDKMIGDVNLFVSEDDSAEEEGGGPRKGKPGLVGEVEIMVAEKNVQGQGYGKAILLSFLFYILVHLAETEEWRTRLQKLRVKIDKHNVRSIRLFSGVGFVLLSNVPNYFGEVEMEWSLRDQTVAQLRSKLQTIVPGWQEPVVLSYQPEDLA